MKNKERLENPSEDTLVVITRDGNVWVGITEIGIAPGKWNVHTTGWTLARKGRGTTQIEERFLIPIKNLTKEEVRELTPNQAWKKYEELVRRAVLEIIQEGNDEIGKKTITLAGLASFLQKRIPVR